VATTVLLYATGLGWGAWWTQFSNRVETRVGEGNLAFKIKGVSGFHQLGNSQSQGLFFGSDFKQDETPGLPKTRFKTVLPAV
jgi:hypothetical protein